MIKLLWANRCGKITVEHFSIKHLENTLKPNKIGNSSVCAIFAHTDIEERGNIEFKSMVENDYSMKKKESKFLKVNFQVCVNK